MIQSRFPKWPDPDPEPQMVKCYPGTDIPDWRSEMAARNAARNPDPEPQYVHRYQNLRYDLLLSAAVQPQGRLVLDGFVNGKPAKFELDQRTGTITPMESFGSLTSIQIEFPQSHAKIPGRPSVRRSVSSSASLG